MMDLVNLKQFNRIHKLNHENWIVWKSKFASALRQVGLWSGIIEEPDDKMADFNVLDLNARLLIGLWIEDSLVPIVQDSFRISAQMMWTTLTAHFNIINEQMRSNCELDDDLTKPDFTTREIALHPALQMLPLKFLSKVNKIFYNPNYELIYVATYSKHYYRVITGGINSRSKVEIKEWQGKNIIQMAASESFSLALTDSGVLNVIHENKPEKEIKSFTTLSDVKKICSFHESSAYILTSDGLVYEQINHDCLQPYVPFWNMNIKDISVSSFGPIALTDDEQIFCQVISKNKPVKIKNSSMKNPKSVHGGYGSFLVLTHNGTVHYHNKGKLDNKFRNQLISTPEAIDHCYDISQDHPNYCLVTISGDCYVWLGEQKKLIRSIARSISDTINLYGDEDFSTKNAWTELPGPRSFLNLLNEFQGWFWSSKQFVICREFFPSLSEFDSLPHAYYYDRYNAIKKTPITRKVISQALKLLREHQKTAQITEMRK